MRTEIERQVLDLLRGGYAFSPEEKRAAVDGLGREGVNVLRDIALGKIATEHPKLRLKAVAALGYDTIEAEASQRMLASLLTNPDVRIAVQAARSFEETPPGIHLQVLNNLVSDPDTRPPVALAAARVVAKYGGPEVIPQLQGLRSRHLSLVDDNEQSPSILALDRLVARARGQSEAGEDSPKVV
jgi:hypothetical protein